MIAENQIREKLGRYLRRDLSLDQFEDWIAQQSWNMHKDSAEAAQRLASAIELRLGEHSSGHLSEAQLRDELRGFANPPMVFVSFGNAQQIPLPEPSNTVMAEAKYLVVTFTSRFLQTPEIQAARSYPEGVVSSGTGQLVGHA